MIVETALSLVTTVCRLKHLFHCIADYLQTHLAFVSASFNVMLALNDQLAPGTAVSDGLLSVAHFRYELALVFRTRKSSDVSCFYQLQSQRRRLCS